MTFYFAPEIGTMFSENGNCIFFKWTLYFMWECPLYVCVKMDIICLCSSGHYSLMWKWTLHFLWKWALHNFVWKWIRYGLCENEHYMFVKMATTFSRSNWHYVFVKLNTAPLCENGNYNIYVEMDTMFFMWQWKLYF